MAADDRDEGFLARWSRLKSAPAAAPEAAAKPDAVAAKAPAVPDDRNDKIDPAELPSIDSLSGESDFSAFLRDGVPDALRRQALRKLWVSDPVIAATDPFDVYNLDYFNAPSFPEGVKTLFRVGYGMLDEAGLEKERLAQAGAASPNPEPDPAPSDAPPTVDEGSGGGESAASAPESGPCEEVAQPVAQRRLDREA